MPAISRLYIYEEPRSPVIDYEEVAAYAEACLGVEAILRAPLLESSIDGKGPLGTCISSERMALSMAAAKVKKTEAAVPGNQSVLPGEVDYELRRLEKRGNSVFGILYDAYLLSGMCAGLIPDSESGIECLHVIFTNQLIGTWEDSDRRYHARSILCGSPSIISISGMVEAPAKAPGYYVARRTAEAMQVPEEEKMELARSFAEDCLSHDDVRLTEVAKGYLMQAAVYRLTGNAFCDDPECRLYNAHWQSELLTAQLAGEDDFCEEHRRILARSAEKDGELFWI